MGRKVLLIAVVLLAAVVAWWLVWLPYRDVSTNVAVVSDAEPLRCTTGTVGLAGEPGRSEGDEELMVDIVDMEPDMNCSWRFFVVNDSGRTITIERVSVPILGRGNGGPGIQASGLGPFESGAMLLDDATADVYWDLVDPLSPDDRWYYEIGLEFDETGCTSEGGTTGLPDRPTVEFRFRGLTFTAESRVATVGFRGTEFSSCDE